MSKSIVFGANGYLGRHLVYFLNKNGHEVIASGRNPISIDGIENYISADVCKKEDLDKFNFNVDFIFVFAGITGTNNGFDQPEMFVNYNEIGLLNILSKHLVSKSKARIIFPSTRLVYKGVENVLLKEEAKKEALTIYAQNKLSCESYLKMYNSYFDVPFTVYRICVPYGNIFDENYSYGTVGFFLNKALNKEDITLYGKGEVKRTLTHVEDICNVIISSLQKSTSINNTYNIGSNDNMSLLEVAELFSNKYQVNINFVDWPVNALKIESGDTMFDDKKLIEDTGFNYKHNLKDWIK